MIELVAAEGEGQHIEFKESISRLDREFVAFANACGGSVFLGISDAGKITGTDMSNRKLSEVHDIARNCDPSIQIQAVKHEKDILEIVVEEGTDKPYRCKDGFFLRVGPSAQKLRRDEIQTMILSQGKFRFDEQLNSEFSFPLDFDHTKLERFLQLAGLSLHAPSKDILLSLDCAEKDGETIRLNNAGVLFFAKEPQRFLPESNVTCVLYAGADRTTIIDRMDIDGDCISIIEESYNYILRNMGHELRITGHLARRQEIFTYPPVAIREAIVNAVMHRDYYNDSSHIYIHLFSNRLEIENPGGLPGGITLEELGERSVRRNRTIADLLYRTKYAEKVGSGIQRMKKALDENNNPPLKISATNYFVLTFFPRIRAADDIDITDRQAMILKLIEDRGSISASEAGDQLNISSDTVLRSLRPLARSGIVERVGTGRAARYRIRPQP